MRKPQIVTPSLLFVFFVFFATSCQTQQNQTQEIRTVKSPEEERLELLSRFGSKQYWVDDMHYVLKFQSSWDRSLLPDFEAGTLTSNELIENALKRAERHIGIFLSESLDYLIQARLGYQDAYLLSKVIEDSELMKVVNPGLLLDAKPLDSYDMSLVFLFQQENLRQRLNLSLEKSLTNSP
jgi:hypothetical protein